MLDLLRRYFQKDPHERLHDLADAPIEIKQALTEPIRAEPVR